MRWNKSYMFFVFLGQMGSNKTKPYNCLSKQSNFIIQDNVRQLPFVEVDNILYISFRYLKQTKQFARYSAFQLFISLSLHEYLHSINEH